MTLKDKTVLVIGAGVLQAPGIRRAARMGLRVLATDMDPHAPGFAAAHGHAVISTLDIPQTIEYAKRNNINGVFTLATDAPLNTVAAVAEACGLPGPAPDVARAATHKHRMKKVLSGAGVPCPGFELARSAPQALRAACRIGWPVVTKPMMGSGSRGVILAYTEKELQAAYRVARQVSHVRGVLIEEFARGRHVCVETFSWRGRHRVLCVIERTVTGPPHFVELEHRFPSTFEKKILLQMEETAVAGLHALGIESGPAHIDMIVTERGPLISEIGARLDGDYKSSHFMPLVFGYDIIADTIRTAVGHPPLLFHRNMVLQPRTTLCIHYLQPAPGVVKKITGKCAVRAARGVCYAAVDLFRGTEIKPFTSSLDRVGVVIARGRTRARARNNAHAAAAQLHIEYNNGTHS